MSKPSISKACEVNQTDSDENLGLLISGLKAALISSIDKELTQLDLTAVQYRIVKLLAQERSSTLANLCGLLDYDRGAMSRLLCRLEAKGILIREPSVEDKRSIYLSLSDKGLSLLPKIEPRVNALYEKALDGFSDQEKGLFRVFLHKSLNNLK